MGEEFEENPCALIFPSLNPKNILGIFTTKGKRIRLWASCLPYTSPL